MGMDEARSKTVYLIVCYHITKDISERKYSLEELKAKLEDVIKDSLTEENLLNVSEIDWAKNTFQRSDTGNTAKKEEERLNLISTCNKAYFQESNYIEKVNRSCFNDK